MARTSAEPPHSAANHNAQHIFITYGSVSSATTAATAAALRSQFPHTLFAAATIAGRCGPHAGVLGVPVHLLRLPVRTVQGR